MTWTTRSSHALRRFSARLMNGVAITLWLALAAHASGCAPRAASAKPTTAAKIEQPTANAATTKAPALPPRQDLPLVLRETLSASMDRHGEELTFLLADVVLLQYEQAEELALLLADEPQLGRPAPNDTESLNALLPEAFFVHQAQLAQRAKVLAAAAHAKDDAALVRAFGALAETCVGCHSAYLHDPLQTAPNHEEGLD